MGSIRRQAKNPDYLDGFPVDFNLNIDARLGDLIRAGAAIGQIPDVVQQQLEEFSGRARRSKRE